MLGNRFGAEFWHTPLPSRDIDSRHAGTHSRSPERVTCAGQQPRAGALEGRAGQRLAGAARAHEAASKVLRAYDDYDFQVVFQRTFKTLQTEVRTPTDYFTYRVLITDTKGNVLKEFGDDYAFLMENQWRVPLPDDAAHWMAVLGMDQYAHLLAARTAGGVLVTSLDEAARAAGERRAGRSDSWPSSAVQVCFTRPIRERCRGTSSYATSWPQRDGTSYVGFAPKAGRASGHQLRTIARLADKYGVGVRTGRDRPTGGYDDEARHGWNCSPPALCDDGGRD